MQRTAATADDELGPSDLWDIEEHGLTEAEVRRQLGLLRNPPPPARLLRACTPGDGVEVLTDAVVEQCLAAHRDAAAAGRLSCFVPASGAASRMFKSLQAIRSDPTAAWTELRRRAASGDATAASVVELLDGIPRLALRGEIETALARHGEKLDAALRNELLAPLLAILLDASELDLGERAKGLLPFHRYPGAPRTAFEEQLVDAASYARRGDGTVHLHFTVSENHREAFARLLEAVRGKYESAFGVHYEVGFSTQRLATDTVAVESDGRAFRDGDGHLLFRPGGHGALLANLNDLGADLLFVKNIDNVVPDHLKPPVVHWKKVLAGRLAFLVQRVHGSLRDLGRDPATAVGPALALLAELGLRPPADVASGSTDAKVRWAKGRLDRPLRACGVVRCEGDPGGAPFWLPDGEGGATPQIVETAQIDGRDPEQVAIHRSATHFNPVDLVCSLRDWRGQPFDLSQYLDPEAVFIAEKSSGGRSLKALEHPGLWNGAMARWITLFVEVPPETFHPVKTINDLLAADHQPPERNA